MNRTPVSINPRVVYHLILVSFAFAVIALLQISAYWSGIALCFTVLIHLAYRQYLYDVEKRASQMAAGDAATNEIPQNYVKHLEQHVSALESTIASFHESQEESQRCASLDPLTELPNRKLIVQSLEHRVDDPAGKFAVLVLNLNRFRMINESLGHSTGDRIIKQVATRINESLRRNDIAGHFGGDEFAVILTDVEDPSNAIKAAEKISSEVGHAIRFKNREVYLNASIGIVFASGEYKRAEDILRDADIAMYNAKDSKKKWAIFDRTMFARTFERQQLETDLRYAIVCNELELFYQPIVRLGDESLYGFESLVRWNHPRRGLLMPSDFIPVAEANGLIAPMSIQILNDSCKQLARWESKFENRPPLTVSVNISAANLADPNLLGQIEAVLCETGVSPESIKLEITESAVMNDAENAIALLHRIKETGVALSIDDFGTGYSSLSYLQKFPLDYLKIDRSFVSAMENGGQNEEIVVTILALAKALKLQVIAEGIESKRQVEKLRDLGCQFGQGFYFSRPVPAREAEDMIRNGESFSELANVIDEHFSYDAGAAIHLDNTH